MRLHLASLLRTMVTANEKWSGLKFSSKGILIFCPGSNDDARQSNDARQSLSNLRGAMVSGGEITSGAVSGALLLGSQ